MKVDHRCRWVRHRLPLLAGGELGVEERRKVERHLIGCPDCRRRRDASTGALAALRSFAGEAPSGVKADAPSLWPALALQIRQSRHASPRPSWWEQLLPRPRAVFTLATGLGAVLAAAIVQPSGQGEAPAIVQPSDPWEDVMFPPPVVASNVPTVEVEPEPPTPLRPHQGALPDSPPRQGTGLSQNSIKPIEPPSSSLRFDYDLDHGTPSGPGNRDPQRTF